MQLDELQEPEESARKKSCKKARRHRHIGIDIASASDNRT